MKGQRKMHLITTQCRASAPSRRHALRRLENPSCKAFTLIELLVVVGIISLLISILLPSLGRAREQAKSVHCRARLHDYATGLVTYASDNQDIMPPAIWNVRIPDEHTEQVHEQLYGWSELLWAYVYREEVDELADFPVQRNINGDRWAKYMLCKTSRSMGINSGHYRVYLPTWSYGTYQVDRKAAWDLKDGDNYPDPYISTSYSQLRPKLILMGDANEFSYQGNGLEDTDGDDHDDNDSSWINANEANEGGFDGNRFSDRHYGHTNFLFADTHAEQDARLRETLARDWDLNGVDDIEEPLEGDEEP